MRRITKITGPDGKVTTIVTRRSGCGCGGIITVLAALFVLFAPAAMTPGRGTGHSGGQARSWPTSSRP